MRHQLLGSFSPNRSRKIWIGLVLIGLMGATLYIGFRQHPSAFDDAYITYRYARNIASGRGFVYNVGESVLGTTTPLYTILLAGLSLIWSDLPLLSHYISVLAWTLCVPIIYGIGQADGRTAVGITAAAFVAFNTLFLNVLGMETTLYVLLAMSTFYLYLKEQPSWAALFAGLSFLVRWDGILVVGVLLFAEMLKRKGTIFRAALVCAIIIIPWLVYSYVTFGSIFPNSFFAKVGQGWNQELGGVEIGSFGRGLFLLAQSAYAENRLFILFPIFGLFGLISVIRNNVRWWPLLLWSAAYLGGYVVLGLLRFPWYYPPLVPAMALLAAEGIDSIAISVSQRLGLQETKVVFIVFLMVLCLIPSGDWLAKNQRTNMDVHSTTYVKVAEWLQNHTTPDSSVAMLEIGILGFYSDRTVVDTMGLVSPEMVGHLEGWLQTLQYAVNHYWPDYVVGLEQTAWTGIVDELWFQEAYALETQIENNADPVAPVRIYRRREGFPLREFSLENPQEVLFDQVFTLHEFQVAEDHIEPGNRLHVQLSWAAEADISDDYRLHFELLNASTGHLWTLAKGLQPMQGGNPTYQWLKGDRVVDSHTLEIPDDLLAGDYFLRLIVEGKDGAVSITDSIDTPASHMAVGPIQIGQSLAELSEPTYPITATFANNTRLIGYDLETASGNSLLVTLYWQATDRVSSDYTVFVHLLSEDELIAQHDSPPLLPTSLWFSDIKVTDVHTLILPTELVADDYQIRVGQYRWPDLERVSISNSGCLNAQNNALLMGHVIFVDTQTPDESSCPDAHWIKIEVE